LLWFDIDDLGVARAEASQLVADQYGIAFLGEHLLSSVVGRPAAAAARIPAGDRRIDPGPQGNAVQHYALLSLLNGAIGLISNSEQRLIPIVVIAPIETQKRHTSRQQSLRFAPLLTHVQHVRIMQEDRFQIV
jgi:hypothetical protein